MATATSVGLLPAPASASALSIKPMNKLPQSPRKIVAGLKLKRRNPRIEPASATVSAEIRKLPPTKETTHTASAENNADPAETPSIPSRRVKALAIHRTTTIVKV